MTASLALHPDQALYDPDEVALATLPVCDHCAGLEVRMRKSLQLQAELGPVFDVTLDNEDGAPVGSERDQAQPIAAQLASADNRQGRVGVRLLPAVHPLFEDVLHTVLRCARAGVHPPGLPDVPEPRHGADVEEALQIISAAQAADWAPIRLGNTLHDRASYRHHWQLLQRGHRTAVAAGPQLPARALAAWFPASGATR